MEKAKAKKMSFHKKSNTVKGMHRKLLCKI